jgi:WD40 repeat protein
MSEHGRRRLTISRPDRRPDASRRRQRKRRAEPAHDRRKLRISFSPTRLLWIAIAKPKPKPQQLPAPIAIPHLPHACRRAPSSSKLQACVHSEGPQEGHICRQVFSRRDQDCQLLSVHLISVDLELSCAAADGTIKVWNFETGKHERTFEGHLSGISIIAWSPDSKWIASGADDKIIRLWNVQTVFDKLLWQT